jgi:alpha-beta hydrolase superfamily lysophospholipase
MQSTTTTPLPEQAGYFSVPGAHLYTVVHQVMNPVARVLLVGPLASERHFTYYPWVRWARYLAARRIEVLRYDYRGVGESTGVFEEMSFENWGEDVQLLVDWIASRSPKLPLLLHGLELGAVLAGRCFHEGSGDALLMWSPPANANRALRSSLMHWAGMEQLFESPENRRSLADYIEQLQQGSLIEVQGYQWSSRLWRDSFHCELPASLVADGSSSEVSGKPVKTVRLTKEAAPLVRPHLRYDEVKDLSLLYQSNFEWIAGALSLPIGGLMKETIETRELFALDGLGGFIRGTYHKPRIHSPGKRPEAIDRNSVGVLFVNSMSPTRAANGDSAAYFCDSFAELGYPSFRLDLPGFGDSDGNPPAELHAYINRGGYASIASAKIAELAERFDLSGMVIVGHCAGAVSAIYAAGASSECKAVILMAPYFYLPQVAKAKTEQQMNRSPYEAVLPENANLPLLRCWEGLASRGIPILILNKPERKSADMKARAKAFDYLEYVLRLAEGKSRVVVRLAEGSDHSFSNRLGRVAVRQHVEEWLDVHFPFKV